MNSLAIIIVNFNGKNFILDCIQSVANSEISVPYEIIVVDNASSDGSVEWMRSQEFKNELPAGTNFKVIANPENIGYGRANNIGFKNSTATSLFVLNPDTRVEVGAIDTLLSTLHADKEIFMTAPQVLDKNLSRITSVWSGFNGSLWPLFVHAFQLQRVMKIHNYRQMFFKGADSKVTCPVDVVSGAAMMVKRETINTLGGFDEDFFMYGEDIEWCIRINKAKKKIYFVPDATVIHEGGTTTEKVWDTLTRQKKMLEGGLLAAKKTMKSYLFRFSMFVYGVSYFFTYVVKAILFKRTNPSFYFRKYFAAALS